MPIPNKRVVVVGVKAAQEQLKSYLFVRVAAERSGKDLLEEARAAQAEAERVAREASGG